MSRNYDALAAQLDSAAPTLEMLRADGVQIEQVHWLWHHWLAAGEVNLIAGVPGTGKTTIALEMAATVTTGGAWPDGSRCIQPANVLVWSGEDSIERTLVPRLKAARADLSRVHIVRGMRDEDGRRPFDPAHDVAALAAGAREIGSVGLLVIDPIVVAVSGDSHKNSETRRGLAPLVEFAHDLGAAIVGVTHFSKSTAGKEPLDRVTGSLAFGALARIVLGAAKRSDDDQVRLLVRIKSNLGRDGGAFAYTVTTTELQESAGLIVASRVTWGEAVEGDARAILADAERTEEDQEDASALSEAMQCLREILSDHEPHEATEVTKEARSAGHSEMTIRRAREALHIRPQRNGKTRKWYWRREQGVQNLHHKKGEHFGHLEHLGSGNGSDGGQGVQGAQGVHGFSAGDAEHLAGPEAF
jgi:hypothetical protein